MANNSIEQNKFDDANKYLEDILLEKDFCILTEVKKKVPNLSSFYVVFHKLRQEYKLLKIKDLF